MLAACRPTHDSVNCTVVGPVVVGLLVALQLCDGFPI